MKAMGLLSNKKKKSQNKDHKLLNVPPSPSPPRGWWVSIGRKPCKGTSLEGARSPPLPIPLLFPNCLIPTPSLSISVFPFMFPFIDISFPHPQFSGVVYRMTFAKAGENSQVPMATIHTFTALCAPDSTSTALAPFPGAGGLGQIFLL